MDHNTTDRNPTATFVFTEAALLGLATLILYVYAYSFEAGIAAFYGYPASLIGATLHSLGAYWLWLVIAYATVFFTNAAPYWPSEGGWLKSFIVASVIYALALQVLFVTAPVWAFGFAVCASIVVIFVVDILYRRRLTQRLDATMATLQADLADNFAAYDKRREAEKAGANLSIYDAKTGYPRYSIGHAVFTFLGGGTLTTIALVTGVVPILLFVSGMFQEIARTDHYLIHPSDGSNGELVLRIVSDKVVSAPFDPTTMVFAASYRVRQATELEDFSLTPLRSGRVKKASN